MKLTQFVISACILMIICSCNKGDKVLSGTWAIDKIGINKLDIKSNLSVNAIKFSSDHHCELPLVDGEGSQQGTWKIEKDDDNTYLIITSGNSLLADKYLFFFFKDPKTKLQRMIMMSFKTELICSKFP